MTLRLVLAVYGLENVRPYRVDTGRNNEHWYVGAGLVLRRYGPFRSDAAIGCEHAILGQLRERGWPVAVPIPSDAGSLFAATSTEITARSTRSGSASTGSCVPNSAGPRFGPRS
jgi:Ser/Thr protein kinase RdoA (MazF antagonist)